MPQPGSGAAWGSLVAGVLSVATLPLAIYLTRFSDDYDLLHASFAIPVAAGLGIASLALARRERRLSELRLGRGGRDGVARSGRLLGITGLCLAIAAVISLGVYGLLEYLGARE